ncbi:MAG: aminomethyltransferase family protein [Pseudomonadales bacterium]
MATSNVLPDHNPIMMLQTPFHSRVAAACEINEWGDWQGYTTPSCYTNVEMEYFAIRSNTGVFDLTPMTKYRVTGPDAEAYLDRLLTRNIAKLGVNRVAYMVMCNDAGDLVEDGTVFRIGEQDFRLCTQERVLDWMAWSAVGFDVDIVDETADVAALAIQGPTSCRILRNMGFEGLENLKPFGMTEFEFAGSQVMISRTGYTGDLGYEAWLAPEIAEQFWDALFEAGKLRGIKPIGSHALDIARIEAGYIAAGVDFVPAEQMIRTGRGRSPLELGLGWLVDFSKPVFSGRKALLKQKEDGTRFRFVKLSVEGNKPAEHSFIYCRGKAVGTVTSAGWCPTAKTNIAMASLEMPYGRPGDKLEAEIYYQRELHWTRLMAKCEIVDGPVWEPKRRLQTPAADF